MASAAGMHMAPWLRTMVRPISMADFPASWEVERVKERSRDSWIYGRRVMLRLDALSETMLQPLITPFGASKTHIIRQSVTQATPEHVPTSWQLRAKARGRHQGRQIVPREVNGASLFLQDPLSCKPCCGLAPRAPWL